jgi:hypothetical protein
VSVHECVRAFGKISGSARLLHSFIAPILRSCEIQRVTHTHTTNTHIHTHSGVLVQIIPQLTRKKVPKT